MFGYLDFFIYLCKQNNTTMTKKERNELSEIIERIEAWNNNPNGLSILNTIGELARKVKEMIENYDKRTS